MSLKEQKENLRKQLLEKRLRLSAGEYLSKSEAITDRLRELEEFRQAGCVHCYVSLNKRKEVNTLPLVQKLLASEKKVAVPVTQFDSGVLSHIYLEQFEDLHANKWGILEPQKGKEASPADIDVVVVPMVGGDYAKNRLGYGKGFYDRFLAETSCPKIGLLFETCLIDQLPVEPFDVPLDILVTEKRIIE